MKEIIFTKPVDGALYLFTRGFKVFPCKPDSKEPAIKGWQEWAEKATEKRIEDFGRANPLHNWGAACGYNDLAVIDIDTKKGKDGEKTLRALAEKHGALPSTLTVLTPSKGKHLYVLGECRNSVGKLGEGIDTRGAGGYVVAPGSRIGDEIYRVIDNSDFAKIPAWIPAAVGAKAEAKVLEDNAPVLEGERNNTLASIAGTMRRRGVGYEGILSALLSINETQLDRPLEESEVETIARSVSRYAPEQAEAAADFLEPVDLPMMSAADINPATLERRDWIMRNRFIGGFISVMIAPGGVGKSTFTMLDAVAVATGKPITGFEIARKGAVWIYNTEDPVDELKRRMIAISQHHKLPLPDLKHVYITSGRDNPFVLAKATREGVAVNEQAIENTVKRIKEKDIKLLLADPFVRTHECNENDNMQIDKVVWAFQKIADRTGCAIGLVHHTSKAGSQSDAGSDSAANAGRGASALVYAARIAHVLSPMSESEAKKFAISPELRRWYMRLDSAKANLQPPAEAADWYKRVSVPLMNGDDVGTVEKVELTDKTIERKVEANRAEISDLARTLSGLMATGERITLRDTCFKVFSNEKFAHLFAYHEHGERSRVNALMGIIGGGPIAYKQKKFTSVFFPELKTKHWIVCEAYDGTGVEPDRVVEPTETFEAPKVLKRRAKDEEPAEDMGFLQ